MHIYIYMYIYTCKLPVTCCHPRRLSFPSTTLLQFSTLRLLALPSPAITFVNNKRSIDRYIRYWLSKSCHISLSSITCPTTTTHFQANTATLLRRCCTASRACCCCHLPAFNAPPFMLCYCCICYNCSDG